MNREYLLYILSRLLKKEEPDGIFSLDETGSRWRRDTDIEILKAFCAEGYGMAKKHGHFIVGTAGEKNYIGIPGRFLAEEQPAGGKTGFTLWQPLRGGEEMYDSLDAMPEKTAELIYGYWIAGIDAATLKIFEA